MEVRRAKNFAPYRYEENGGGGSVVEIETETEKYSLVFRNMSGTTQLEIGGILYDIREPENIPFEETYDMAVEGMGKDSMGLISKVQYTVYLEGLEGETAGSRGNKVADSSANLPRERAKALSYCQPQRGGGVKVLLRFLSPRRKEQRGVAPLRGLWQDGT